MSSLKHILQMTTICWLIATLLLHQTSAMPTETDEETEVTYPSTSCSYNNQVYEQGKRFWPNLCSVCICQATGTISCNTMTCPLLNCSKYHQEERLPLQCCSSCRRVTCYWRGNWYAGGEIWQDRSLDNGQYCQISCQCVDESKVQCNKTKCRAISQDGQTDSRNPKRPSSSGTKKKVCRSDGNKYRPGQNWTKETLYHGHRCTVPCICKKRGKSVCNISLCKTRIPLQNYQLGPKASQTMCSDPNLGQHQHGHKVLYYDQNDTPCVKECICLSRRYYCNGTSCTQASEKMPTCGLISKKVRSIQVENCTSAKRQPATHCPQYCAPTGSLQFIQRCLPVTTDKEVLFKCPDRKRRHFTVKEVTSCKCSADQL